MDLSILKQNLEASGYDVAEFDTKEDATAYLNEQIDGQSVAFGGSVTIQQMGLYEALASHNEVLWHWAVPEGKTAPQVLAEARTTDVYISSVNGVAESGEIINIDGNGNRVAGIMYGHKKVYLLISENKVAKDYESALFRARNIAAPLNAVRLGKKTPCAVKGDRCYNCSSPDRICNELSVLWKKPYGCAYEVILIHGNLGY